MAPSTEAFVDTSALITMRMAIASDRIVSAARA